MTRPPPWHPARSPQRQEWDNMPALNPSFPWTGCAQGSQWSAPCCKPAGGPDTAVQVSLPLCLPANVTAHVNMKASRARSEGAATHTHSWQCGRHRWSLCGLPRRWWPLNQHRPSCLPKGRPCHLLCMLPLCVQSMPFCTRSNHLHFKPPGSQQQCGGSGWEDSVLHSTV